MITAESLAQKLSQAEQTRDEALRAAQHWEGRAAAIRELLAQVNQPEPTPNDEH
jgi:hypothetical protein